MTLRPHDLRPRTLYPSAWLLGEGMHPRDLASEELTRAIPGYVMRTDAPADLRSIAEVVQRRLRPGAVISHETAAEIFRFPLPKDLTREGGAPIRCRVTAGGKRTAGRLLVVHVRAAAPTIRFHGLTISHPVIALQEIAGSLSHPDLVACVDAVAADRHGAAVPVSLQQIRKSVAPLKGRGADALRSAVADARERVWSPMETKVRLMILARGYPEPVPNLEFIDPATGIVYYVDLAYPQWKIAIEYDGQGHWDDKQQWEKDLHKNEVLHDQAWKVLRIAIADYMEPETFFQRLDAAIAEREQTCPDRARPRSPVRTGPVASFTSSDQDPGDRRARPQAGVMSQDIGDSSPSGHR